MAVSVRPGDWIIVEGLDCVVSDVRHDESVEVVFNSANPTNRDVLLSDGEWQFVKDETGGYAKGDRRKPFVAQLKRGK